MFEGILEQVAARRPLVHCITNYVTVGDVANMVRACGGSPIMADDPAEVEEITAICDGLALNTGTLNARTIPSMLAAGRAANRLGRPVVLDPVGAGASRLRTETVRQLLEQVRFTVIRGNSSEMRVVAQQQPAGASRGVDAGAGDATSEQNLDQVVRGAKELAGRTGAVVAVTGAIDVVAGPQRAYIIRNGHPMMERITGTGCMLTGVVAAWCAANPQDPLRAAAAAVCAMGLCGQLAWEQAQREGGGVGLMRIHLADWMGKLTSAKLEEGKQVELG